MITIKNIKTLDEQLTTIKLPSSRDEIIEANGQLLLMPGLVDPHISLGDPQQEAWKSAIQAALRGGITTAIDIPLQNIPYATNESLQKKRKVVDEELAALSAPLHCLFYATGSPTETEQLGLAKKLLQGVALLLGSAQLKKKDAAWDRLFQMAAWEDLPIIINAKNENSASTDTSKEEESLLEKAIYYAERQNTRLYVLNVSNKHELELIREGKKRSLLIYSETTPHHLFSNQEEDSTALWEALNANVIESIGSGFSVADQNPASKIIFQNETYDFANPIFLLPQLLTAAHAGKIAIEKLVQALCYNVNEIFNLPNGRGDAVLVNLEQERTIQKMQNGRSLEITLKGWPAYTIIEGQIFHHP